MWRVELNLQPTLEGECLLLRPLKPADWDALFDVASDPQIWAQHPKHDRWQEPVFRAFFDDALASGGALAVIARDSGEIIGSSRYAMPPHGNGEEVEIGWTFLARRFWGEGFNQEMKRLMIAHALGSVERTVFSVGEANWISRRAMENIGGALTTRTQRVLCPVADGQAEITHVIYAIDRASFAVGPLSRARP